MLDDLTTAILMVLLLNGGAALLGRDTLRRRRIPWWAVGLTAVAVGGVVLQLAWSGAMDALDADPGRAGWWREFTAIFLQNGGVVGVAFNLLTMAAIAALAEWFWGGPLMLALFVAGMVLPSHLDALLGVGSGVSTDPRNFVGSSGATYFLGATLTAALLWRAASAPHRLLALSVPVLGLAMWFTMANAHGLVTTDGFVLGLVVALLVARGSIPNLRGKPAGPNRWGGHLRPSDRRPGGSS